MDIVAQLEFVIIVYDLRPMMTFGHHIKNTRHSEIRHRIPTVRELPTR